MEWLIPLITLTAMEIVLGIDNVVFIAILSTRLPAGQQQKARSAGLTVALLSRLILLFSLSWLLGLTEPLFHLTDLGIPEAWVTDDTASAAHGGDADERHDVNGISWRDLILLTGGMFLIGKSVTEIHARVEGLDHHGKEPETVSFAGVMIQIAILDIVFSLDSVITALGMAEQLWVMVTAVVIAMLVMLAAAGSISGFVQKHPTLKILALSFLILIGVMLVAESIGTPINKGYIYFAMAFSLVVEILNLQIRRRSLARSEGSIG